MSTLAAAQAGDEQAFAELVAGYRRELRRPSTDPIDRAFTQEEESDSGGRHAGASAHGANELDR